MNLCVDINLFLFFFLLFFSFLFSDLFLGTILLVQEDSGDLI